jgi:hypothetical protein
MVALARERLGNRAEVRAISQPPDYVRLNVSAVRGQT